MARLIPSAERIKKARLLIQQARDLPLPPFTGRSDFSYITEVKGLLKQAGDLVKFIPDTPSATPEIKAQVKLVFQEIEQTKNDLFYGKGQTPPK